MIKLKDIRTREYPEEVDGRHDIHIVAEVITNLHITYSDDPALRTCSKNEFHDMAKRMLFDKINNEVIRKFRALRTMVMRSELDLSVRADVMDMFEELRKELCLR